MSEFLPALSQGGALLGFFGEETGVGKPFATDIYLTSFLIAGTRHVKAIEDYMEDLEPDREVRLVRESSNAYDSMAILVKDQDGHKLGYVPRNMNHIPARLLDAGKLLYGKVILCDNWGGEVSIRIGIYMKD